ncbi:NTP transferase domain-containing protein [Arcanobacterium phocisimile]|uniref:NTP transferase domain-containing protein n=1 Tax=Arcanobacterium phocisimile TaxID=1302235 RepID=A0ABX7IFB1_9ACTO|nr:NTP transferase domain-containing protein [Arcanobacterium phocisimile]QRV01717.1 NTP transferase domain-containing protein [Arcanobacterium phocisimile]
MRGTIFLGGGRAKRLHGQAKPHLQIGDRSLLTHAIACLEQFTGNIPCVLVSPPDRRIPAKIIQTLEDPPYGGPVAGISAGLAALDRVTKPDNDPPPNYDFVAIFSADAPLAPLLLPALFNAARGHQGAIASWEGKKNYLVGIYQYSALVSCLPSNPHGMSARVAFADIDLATVDDLANFSADIDHHADIKRVQTLVAQHAITSRRHLN